MYIYIDMYNITKIAPWLHGYEQVSPPPRITTGIKLMHQYLLYSYTLIKELDR